MAEFNTVKVPQLAWYGDTEFAIELPSSWEVAICQMQGRDRPRLTPAEIMDRFLHPIGCPPIRELAKGRKEVVILFDDLTRPTPVADLVPYVLEELGLRAFRMSI